VFQTTEEWMDSELGVHPVQVALQVALPELDGAIEPIVFAGRDSNTGKSHSLPDRIQSLCSRAVNWAVLRKKKNAEKKLAISNLKILSPLLGFSIPDYGVTFQPKDAQDRRAFRLLHIPTLVSSAFFVIFWKVAKFGWVRAFYDKLPLRYIHLAGGLRRRLTNYRRANMTEIEAIYREAGEMKIIPGTCHPLAGKKKSRSEAEEKQKSCVAAFNE
jgi:hypothetical protein